MWQPTHVKVTVKQAQNLLTKGKNGTNDAFVVIGIGKEKYQTSVKEKSLPSVEWREECELAIPDQGNKANIQLTVYHHNNLGLDEFLGQVSLPLTDFDVYEKPKYRSYRLKGKPEKDKKKGEKERGELEVMVNFTVKSGSLLDVSKKEKHKSSLTSLKHIGGSLMSIGAKEKQGLKNFAKSVSSKMDKMAKPKKKKSKAHSESFSNDLMTSQQRFGDADPGVISDDDEDDFRFDDDVKVNTRTSSPMSTMSRGSSMHEHVLDTDIEIGSFEDYENDMSGSFAKSPTKPPRIVDETKEKQSFRQFESPSNSDKVTSFSDPKHRSSFKGSQDLTRAIIEEEEPPVKRKAPKPPELAKASPEHNLPEPRPKIRDAEPKKRLIPEPELRLHLEPFGPEAPENFTPESEIVDRKQKEDATPFPSNELELKPKQNFYLEETEINQNFKSGASPKPVPLPRKIGRELIDPESDPVASVTSIKGKNGVQMEQKAPKKTGNEGPVEKPRSARKRLSIQLEPDKEITKAEPKKELYKVEPVKLELGLGVPSDPSFEDSSFQSARSLGGSGGYYSPDEDKSFYSYDLRSEDTKGSSKMETDDLKEDKKVINKSGDLDFTEYCLKEESKVEGIPLSSSSSTNDLNSFKRGQNEDLEGRDSAISSGIDRDSVWSSSRPRSTSNASSVLSSTSSALDTGTMAPPPGRCVEDHPTTLLKSSSDVEVILRRGSSSEKRKEREMRVSSDVDVGIPIVARSGSMNEKRSSASGSLNAGSVPTNLPPTVVDEWERKLYGRSGMTGSTENISISGSRSSLNNTSRESSIHDVRRDDSFTRLPEVKALTLDRKMVAENDEEAKKQKRKQKSGFKNRFFKGGSRERLNEESRFVEGGNDRLPTIPSRPSKLPQEVHDKFAGKSREDLLELILNLESSLEKQVKQKSDLEEYIDNLLLRVMEATPHILQAPPKKSKAYKYELRGLGLGLR